MTNLLNAAGPRLTLARMTCTTGVFEKARASGEPGRSEFWPTVVFTWPKGHHDDETSTEALETVAPVEAIGLTTDTGPTIEARDRKCRVFTIKSHFYNLLLLPCGRCAHTNTQMSLLGQHYRPSGCESELR